MNRIYGKELSDVHIFDLPESISISLNKYIDGLRICNKEDLSQTSEKKFIQVLMNKHLKLY